VTAREAYNIAKAAEAGAAGNPNDYRNFLIPPYVNRFLSASAPYDVITMDHGRLVARFLTPPGSRVDVWLRSPHVSVSGDATVISTASSPEETEISLTTESEGLVEFDMHPRAFAVLSNRAEQNSEFGIRSSRRGL
jgi:hypothetical protein